MKQFIYLDMDIVNSIIAQSQKGIVVQQTLSNDNQENQADSMTMTLSGDTKFGGSLFKLIEAAGNLGIARTSDKSHVTMSTTSDVIEKVLHDAAFDIAYEYINPYEVTVNQPEYDEEGNYILIRRAFNFVDLDYLEAFFSKNGLIDYLKEIEEAQIRQTIEGENSLNREQYRKSKSEINKEIKKRIDLNNQQYDEVGRAITALRSMIPYNRMLISSDGYLIPLDEQYFRINPKNLGFKYGGEITCVGMITNIFGEDTDPSDDNNIFATLQYTASEALRMILPTKENNICVVHPIAIYYGE